MVFFFLASGKCRQHDSSDEKWHPAGASSSAHFCHPIEPVFPFGSAAGRNSVGETGQGMQAGLGT
jgi:hypothetical protein